MQIHSNIYIYIYVYEYTHVNINTNICKHMPKARRSHAPHINQHSQIKKHYAGTTNTRTTQNTMHDINRNAQPHKTHRQNSTNTKHIKHKTKMHGITRKHTHKQHKRHARITQGERTATRAQKIGLRVDSNTISTT